MTYSPGIPGRFARFVATAGLLPFAQLGLEKLSYSNYSKSKANVDTEESA